MDGRTFDALTKHLATGATRRRLLNGLVGGAAAAGLAVVGGRGPAAAQDCKADGKACKKNSQCCSQTCVGGTGTGSTAHSEGVCGTVGQLFVCTCRNDADTDGPTHSLCRQAECDFDPLEAICLEVCLAEGFSGFNAHCNPGDVCLL